MGRESSTAVMARRMTPAEDDLFGRLDFYPTPPWAARALPEIVLPHMGVRSLPIRSVWEPAAGEGHMAEPLRSYCLGLHASDVHDYGRGYHVQSYVGVGPDVAPPLVTDWVITNPPFTLAHEFIARALSEAREGVAMLLRTVFVEGVDRYNNLFKPTPPTLIAPFAERVPMTKGRWDPDASTATSYAWFVWRKDGDPMPPFWIPPGQRAALTRFDDARRYGVKSEGALL